MRKFILWFLSVLFLLGSWKLGYWISAPNPKSDSPVQPKPSPTLNSPRMRQPTSALPSESHPSSESRPESRPESRTDTPSYDSWVAHHQLQKMHQDFSQVFSHSEQGQALVQIATLSLYGRPMPTQSGSNLTPEGLIVREQMIRLRSQPEATLQELNVGLSRWGARYPRERESLVQFAFSLDVNPETKTDFFSEELQRSATITSEHSDHPAPFAAINTLALLMETTDHPKRIEEPLRKILSMPVSSDQKIMLLSTYGNKYPLQATQLKKEFGL